MVKCLAMKLMGKLPTKTFVISQIFILILGLIFTLGIYYLMSQPQNQTSNLTSSGTITSAPSTLMLNLNSPDDDALSFSSSILISGKTLPNLSVLVTSTKDLVVQSKKDGSFSADVELSPGVNEIMVVAFDASGEERKIQRTVYYSKEKI